MSTACRKIVTAGAINPSLIFTRARLKSALICGVGPDVGSVDGLGDTIARGEGVTVLKL